MVVIMFPPSNGCPALLDWLTSCTRCKRPLMLLGRISMTLTVRSLPCVRSVNFHHTCSKWKRNMEMRENGGMKMDTISPVLPLSPTILKLSLKHFIFTGFDELLTMATLWLSNYTSGGDHLNFNPTSDFILHRFFQVCSKLLCYYCRL